MPYFDVDGNEVEGLVTADEAKTMVDESTKELVEEKTKAVTEADAKVTAATTATEALQKQIDDATAAAAAAAGGGGAGGTGDADKNLVNLRKKLEEQTALAVAATEASTVRIAALEGDKVSQAIKTVAGTDADLEAKIRHNYDKTLSGVTAVTAEEIASKVDSAVKLSGGVNIPNPLDVAGNGAPQGGGGAAPANAVGKDFNSNETSVGNKLGVNDADREKYGNDPRLTNMNTK